MYTYIAIDSFLLSWESHHWGRFTFQLIFKLGVPLLEQVCYLQLLLRWEVPAGTGLFMQLLARFWYSVAWVTIFCNQVGCLAALITIAELELSSSQNSFWCLLDPPKFSHIVTKWMNHEASIILLLAAFC